jgi:hypothetical protein
MKVSFILVLIMLASILSGANAAVKIDHGATRVEISDPFELHPCKVRQSAETLEELWAFVTDRIRGNNKYPGQLVRDMVDLACIQRNLYAYSDDGGKRADLKARFSDSMYPFLLEVVDNFKVGLRKLQEKITTAQYESLSSHINALPPQEIKGYMALHELLKPGDAKENSIQRFRTHEAIRRFVDVRSLLIQRFIAAYPLLLHVTKSMQETHDVFKGVAQKVYKVKPATKKPSK